MTKPNTDIVVCRVDDAVDGDNRCRTLLDRLWPRGVKQGDLRPDEWLNNVSRGDELRQCFNQEPERWEEYQTRCADELKAETWTPLLETARRKPVR